MNTHSTAMQTKINLEMHKPKIYKTQKTAMFYIAPGLAEKSLNT